MNEEKSGNVNTINFMKQRDSIFVVTYEHMSISVLLLANTVIDLPTD